MREINSCRARTEIQVEQRDTRSRLHGQRERFTCRRGTAHVYSAPSEGRCERAQCKGVIINHENPGAHHDPSMPDGNPAQVLTWGFPKVRAPEPANACGNPYP